MLMIRQSLLACFSMLCFVTLAIGQTEDSQTSASPVLKAVAALDALGGTYGLSEPKGAEKEAIETLGYDIRSYWDIKRVSLGPGNAPYDPKNPITDERLLSLHSAFLTLQNIELLDLTGTSTTNEGIRSLPPMLKLKILRLEGTKIGNGLHELLVRFPNLESISVIDTDFTAPEWVAMQKKYPRLKIIRKAETKNAK